MDPILLILSSDHQIEDIDNFHLAIKNSIQVASEGNLVILELIQQYASTGYGYIKSENHLEYDEYLANKVNHFIEKPNKATAEIL